MATHSSELTQHNSAGTWYEMWTLQRRFKYLKAEIN
jgi:hypothetical protein